MGWKKKRGESILFKNRISAEKEEGKMKQPKKVPIRREGGERFKKSVHVRTPPHVRHFPDLPSGEITIEGTGIVKHCTTAKKKSPRIQKWDWKKKRREVVQKKNYM